MTSHFLTLERALLTITFFLTCFSPFKASSQTSYRPASQYQLPWQRLLLQLSSTYYHVVKEGQVDLDNSLLYTSHSLGLTRMPILAEGINNKELLARSAWVDQKEPKKGVLALSKAKGKEHLELLLLLGAYYAFEPYSYHRYRDSVEYFLNQAVKESKTIKEEILGRQALCLLGKVYVQANDLTNGDVVFNHVISECRAVGDKETEARAFAYRGLYTAYSPPTTESRIMYLQKAKALYQKLKNKEGEVNVLTNMGYLYVTTFNTRAAYDVFLEAIKIEQAISFPYTHYNTDAAAMLTTLEGKFGEPLRYALETAKTAETNRDSIGWAYFYNRLGGLYNTEGGRDAEGLKWLQKSMDRFIITRDPSLYLNLLNLVPFKSKDGKAKETLKLIESTAKKIPPRYATDSLVYHLALSVCYSSLRQFDLAEMHILKAALLEKSPDVLRRPFRGAGTDYYLSVLYFNKGNYSKARFYSERSLLDPAHGRQTIGTDIIIYNQLIYIDSVQNDPISGLKHYKSLLRLQDSTFKVSKVRQAEELQVRYLTEEKENQIILLNQQAKLQQANTKQARMVKNFTTVGIIGVLLIAGLLYRQNKLKQRNNNVITHKNQLLQHLLSEKEWLLKEVHHRVKNNLHTVICLLESQAAYLENDALKAIENSQHRIYAMSLIHQKLYQSEDIKSIDMSVYIAELIQYLKDSFDISNQIHFQLKIDPINLNISHAIPLGLIINEAITNSIKYAFPNNRKGEITISLMDIGDQIQLNLSDNGIGMPQDTAETDSGSLGLELMKGLSGDIKANISFDTTNGTKITIAFKRDFLNDPNNSLNLLSLI